MVFTCLSPTIRTVDMPLVTKTLRNTKIRTKPHSRHRALCALVPAAGYPPFRMAVFISGCLFCQTLISDLS
jgi:hypothetical protein